MSDGETNKKIYASLMKRDSKEKEVVLGKLIGANDALTTLVFNIRNELDEAKNLIEKEKSRVRHLQESIDSLARHFPI